MYTIQHVSRSGKKLKLFIPEVKSAVSVYHYCPFQFPVIPSAKLVTSNEVSHCEMITEGVTQTPKCNDLTIIPGIMYKTSLWLSF